MGFYGNLTNTARTQFQFDRIYPNRYSMERNIATDGVYIGRYVLVEYDENIHEDSIKVAYVGERLTDQDNMAYYDHYYTTIDHTQEFVFNTYAPVATGVVNENNFINYYVEENGLHHPATGYDAETIYYSLENGSLGNGIELGEIVQTRNYDGTLNGEFFKCVGSNQANIALFGNISEEVENNFLTNYQIDITYFGPRSPEGAYSRAWDSTVWQKVYAAGEVKYLMIAELNTASPSFSLTFDPPTQTPLAPHVDASSANNVYRVHLQPSWGFRIKEEEDEDKSDAEVYHISSTYDSMSNRVDQHRSTVNGALYWNNKGIDIAKSVHDDSLNYIAMEPTGQSGMVYASHKGYIPTSDTQYEEGKDYWQYDENFLTYTKIDTSSLTGTEIENPDEVYEYITLPAYDINELSIHMPAFGNAVADFYDLMYGVNADNKNLRYRDTEWKYYNGVERAGADDSIGGMTRNKSTVAGTLNYIHDLTGMIIARLREMPTDEEVQTDLSSDLIYWMPSASELLPDSYYFRAQTVRFDTTKVNYVYDLVDTTTEPYLENCYFTLPAGTIFDADSLAQDLGQYDYNAANDYYKRLISGSTYKRLGVLTNYAPGRFYYRIGSDYFCETSSGFESDRIYYSLDTMFRFKEVSPSDLVEQYHHYYFDLSENLESSASVATLADRYGSTWIEMGWYDTEDTFFQADKTYYVLQNNSTIAIYEDWEPDTLIPDYPRIVERQPATIEYGTTTVAELNSPLDLWNNVDVVKRTENSIQFKGSYLSDTFYYLVQTGTVEISSGNYAPVYDYCLDGNYPYTTDREYYSDAPNLLSSDTVIYQPNRYFYFDDDDGETAPFDINAQPGEAGYPHPRKDINEYPTSGRYYWDMELSDPVIVMLEDGTIQEIRTVIGWTRISNLVSVTGQFIVHNEETTLDELSPATPAFNYYYKTEDETQYHMIHINNRNVLTNDNYQFYYLGLDIENARTLMNDDFYIKDIYYYFDEQNNFLVDHNLTADPLRHYYAASVLDDNLTQVQFYIPNTYYYKIGDVYILDTEDTTTETEPYTIYYEKDAYCVAADRLGIYAVGCPWNTKATMVPCTITLGVSEPWYELREIGNVGTKTNSINNLILKYNKTLADGDQYIRSNNTVQGTLNLYKDTIRRFDSDIAPNKLVITDPYGRITNADYSIQQLLDRIAQLEARVAELES